jgi:hypothetical protein
MFGLQVRQNFLNATGIPPVMPLSTTAVAGALLHIKSTFDRNLEFFFLLQFRLL